MAPAEAGLGGLGEQVGSAQGCAWWKEHGPIPWLAPEAPAVRTSVLLLSFRSALFTCVLFPV